MGVEEALPRPDFHIAESRLVPQTVEVLKELCRVFATDEIPSICYGGGGLWVVLIKWGQEEMIRIQLGEEIPTRISTYLQCLAYFSWLLRLLILRAIVIIHSVLLQRRHTRLSRTELWYPCRIEEKLEEINSRKQIQLLLFSSTVGPGDNHLTFKQYSRRSPLSQPSFCYFFKGYPVDFPYLKSCAQCVTASVDSKRTPSVHQYSELHRFL